MTTSNVIELNISEKSYSYARIYASLLKDDFQRKRAYASLVALYALIDAFEKTDNEVQKSMTLFRNPILNEQYEISDIYINNWHIDVRVFVDGDAVLVPKTHFDNNIAPDFYAVVKVDSKLEKAELIGFADVQNVEKEAFDYHYSSIALKSLISYDAFLAKVCNPKQVEFTDEEHKMFQELYLSFMDDEMKPEIKNKLLKHLFNCVQCRTEFCCFTGFEMVSCNMGSYPNLFDDMTLNIVGAQAVDSEKYAGKEQTIYIGPDVETNEVEEADIDVDTVLDDITPIVENVTPVVEESSISVQEKVEEVKLEESQTDEVQSAENEMTVADILDELFSIEEGYIEPEIPQEKQPEENNIDEDALEKIVAEKIKEDEAAFEEDEPLDSYEEIPLDNVEPTLVDSEPSIQKDETLEEMAFSDTTPEPLELTEDEIPVLDENIQDIDSPTIEEVLTLDKDETSDIEEPVIEEYVDDEEIVPLETENIKNVSDEMEVFEESLVENFVNESEEFSIESETSLFASEEPAELEVLETNEDLEVIEDDIEGQNSEIEITDLQTDDNDTLQSSIEEFEDADLEIHSDVDEEMDILIDSESLVQNATKDAKESIQQVIVDYDEFGEPIYSYITSVAQEAQFITDDAIDDDIMNEVFETYPTEEENYELENNDSAVSRPVEYVTNEEAQEFEEWNDDVSKTSNQEDEYPEYEQYNDEETDVPETYEEYVDEDVVTSEEDVNEDTNAMPLPSVDVNYQDDEIEETSVDDDEVVTSEENDDAEEEDTENFEDEDETLENDEFEEDEDDEEEEEEVKKKGSPLLVLVALLLIVAGGAAGAFIFFKNKNQDTNSIIVPETTTSTNTLEIPLTVPSEPEQVTDMFGTSAESDVVQDVTTGEIVASGNGATEQASEIKSDVEKLPALPKTENTQQKTVQTPKTVAKEQIASTASRSKALANAFSNGGNRATLRSVNWLCAPQLFTDSVFKAYMQDLDNVLKLNLRKNILDATETPQNNTVTVKMAIDKAGNLSKVLISESSGSKQIDDIVLQSINESFEGEKSQDLNNSALKQDMYYLKVAIKL